MHKPIEIHWKATSRILTSIKGFPGKRLLYKNHVHLQIKAFQIQIMQEIKEIENLLLATAFTWEVIWLLERVSRMLYLVPLLK